MFQIRIRSISSVAVGDGQEGLSFLFLQTRTGEILGAFFRLEFFIIALLIMFVNDFHSVTAAMLYFVRTNVAQK